METNTFITKKSELTKSEAYEQALAESSKYLPNSLGMISEDPTSQSDKRFVRQNNTIIALLLPLHTKIDMLSQSVLLLKTQQEGQHNSDIDGLIKGMNKLQLSSSRPLVKQRSTIFSYYQ